MEYGALPKKSQKQCLASCANGTYGIHSLEHTKPFWDCRVISPTVITCSFRYWYHGTLRNSVFSMLLTGEMLGMDFIST